MKTTAVATKTMDSMAVALLVRQGPFKLDNGNSMGIASDNAVSGNGNEFG